MFHEIQRNIVKHPDKPVKAKRKSRFIGKPKIFATKALRHKGYIYYSFFVPWCLSGKMEKVLSKKAQNSILSKKETPDNTN
jgi:hypothetical protein